VVGVLSALPIISVGNFCCCLWVVSGGAVAAYVLQQNQLASLTPGDAALAGLLAGLAGAFIYLVLSIPITLLMAPMEAVMMERFIDSGRLPPEIRELAGTYMGGAIKLAVGFFFMLVVGSMVAALGGLIGSLIFKKPVPPGTPPMPGTIDVPTQSG
jgi:hypothetical protein